MAVMRALVAADRVGPLDPRSAAEAVARAFVDESATCDAVPLPGTGAEVVALLRSLGEPAVSLDRPAAQPGLPTTSSFPLGAEVRRALAAAPAELVVDLAAAEATHDAGAGILAALGATADIPLDAGWPALAGLTAVDLAPVDALLAGTSLVGLVPNAQADAPLLGLRGISSVRAHVARLPHADAVAVDSVLERFVTTVDADAALAPGAGACGGAGWAVLALGGRLATAPGYVGERAGIAALLESADVIVTVVEELNGVTRGGDSVAFLEPRCAAAGRPLVVLARHVQVSRREMRSFGVEEAFELGEVATSDELRAAARTAARCWRW